MRKIEEVCYEILGPELERPSQLGVEGNDIIELNISIPLCLSNQRSSIITSLRRMNPGMNGGL